jgi:hypothetical protein
VPIFLSMDARKGKVLGLKLVGWEDESLSGLGWVVVGLGLDSSF